VANSERRFLDVPAAVALCLGLELAGACISPVSLENRPCPCASGYVCCDSTRTCLRAGQVCSIRGSAAGGGAGAPAAGGQGAGAGEVGVAGAGEAGDGSAGSAGAPPAPSWQDVGADVLTPEPTNAPNLALDAAGTPHLAFRACGPCAPPEEAVSKPVVARYAGVWEVLPSTGLPAQIKMSPALHFDQAGNPVVLTEEGLHAFDGEEWLPAPALPFPPSQEARLARDDQGRFHTTAYDHELAEIHVVRLEGSSWQRVGAPIPGDGANAGLYLAGAFAYLAHSRPVELTGTSEFVVRRFDGVAWEIVSTFEGSGLELALSPEGTVYAAIREPQSEAARILQQAGDGWLNLGVFPASLGAPRLELSAGGTLYMTNVVGSFVNVLRRAGGAFEDLDSAALGSGMTLPVLRIAALGSADVPIVAFLVDPGVRVRKYE